MAFNLGAFGAGFASKLTDRLDEERVRAEKLIDENRQIATQQRLKKQASRDAEKLLAKELTESLSIYYTPDQVADIMGNGTAQAKYALAKGQTYDGKNLDASTQYTLPNNEITNPDGATADAAVPAAIGTFTSRFKKTPKKKTWDTLAAFQINLLERKINAVGDAEELSKIEADEAIWLTQAADLEKAKRKAEKEDGDSTEPIYSDESRRKLINDAVTYHRLSLDVQADISTGIISGIEGNNNLQMAEIRAAADLKVTNFNGFKETQLDSRIKSMVENATVSLNEFAKNKVRQEGTAYPSWDALQAAIANQSIVSGSTYAYQTTAVNAEGQPTTVFQGGTYLGEYGKNAGIENGYINLPTTYSPSVQFTIIQP